jgi:hypothetical protein
MTLPSSHWDRHEIKSRSQWFQHCIPNTMGFEAHFQLYWDIIEWIQKNIHHHRRNTRWTKMGDGIYVQFKKETDFMLFMLRWA